MTVDATFSPQKVRRQVTFAGRVEGVGDLVELVGEQVAVQVEGHRGRLVTQHRLHDLDVGAGRDGQAGRGVAQQVGVEAGQAHRRRGVGQDRALEALGTERSAADAGEDEVLRALGRDVLGQLVEEKPRDRHRPPFVALGRAPDAFAADERHRLGDGGSTAQQIEPADAQRSHLAEPDAGVGEEQHRQPVRPAAFREIVDLVVGEVDVLDRDDARQVDAVGGVTGQPAILDGELQHQR